MACCASRCSVATWLLPAGAHRLAADGVVVLAALSTAAVLARVAGTSPPAAGR